MTETLEARTESGPWFRNAPWWLVSAGLHLVVLLGAALIYVERLYAVVTPPLVVDFHPPQEILPPEEKLRDVEKHKGVPIDGEKTPPTTDPVIWNPFAEEGKKNQSADNDPHEEMKGQSKEFLSYLPGDQGGFRGTQLGSKSPGTVDTLGIGRGNGSAGRFGGRFGGLKNERVKGGGGGDDTESAVTAALRWLARHQNPDGSWSAEGFSHKCVGSKCPGAGERDYDAGVTSLSLLAFLGAGFTQLSKDEMVDPAVPDQTLRFGEVVKKALQWLTQHQDPEGCVGERGQKYMYNHAVAALALSEAYGMTAAPVLREPAQKAIDFLVAAQNPGKGWRYSARCADNDTSVTGWAVMALKSAEMSDLSFPRSAFTGALSWFEEATEKNGYYRTGYNAAGTGKVYVPGKNEAFADHASMSAVMVMSRIFIQKERTPALNAVGLLTSDLPAWKPGQVDFYYWYYASLALFQYDGPKGPSWNKWNEPMKNAIVPHQKTAKNGCENGSWDPSVDRWGFEGGRVYAAALNALTLEVYYRYVNVFGVTSRK